MDFKLNNPKNCMHLILNFLFPTFPSLVQVFVQNVCRHHWGVLGLNLTPDFQKFSKLKICVRIFPTHLLTFCIMIGIFHNNTQYNTIQFFTIILVIFSNFWIKKMSNQMNSISFTFKSFKIRKDLFQSTNTEGHRAKRRHASPPLKKRKTTDPNIKACSKPTKKMQSHPPTQSSSSVPSKRLSQSNKPPRPPPDATAVSTGPRRGRGVALALQWTQ